MKKRGWNIALAVLLLLALLFLSSCKGRGPGDTPPDTAAALKLVQSGSQGVEISLLPNFPPPTLYDQDELVTILEVKNKGNYDLDAGSCFVQVTGFDPNIIRGGLNVPRSCAERLGQLEGKNIYNLEGGINQIELRSSSIYLPEGVFEYNPTLNFVTCYNYHTRASPSICVDPAFYQIATEQKVCTPHDVGMGGGQGAPVGISSVGVDMVGARAIFEINVRNFGSGRVLSPFSDLQACGQTSFEFGDLDKVSYSAQFSGGSLVDCKPHDGMIRLVNGNGKIVCTFNVAGSSAYESPLLVDLDYNYLQSFKKSVKIVKTPQ